MKYLILIFFSLSNNILSQNNKILTDSLKKYSYEDLINKVSSSSLKNNLLSSLYAKAYLEKAKLEKNNREIIYGYDLFAQSSINLDEALKFSCISIKLANKNYPKALPYLYLTRGNIYYNKNKLKEALNCYLIAYNQKTKIPILENKINYSIGLIKKTQGKYEEALPIYKRCLENATKIKDANYIRYILGLGEIYERINNINEAKKNISLGIRESKKTKYNSSFLCYFISNRGKIYFKEKKYKQAILDLIGSLYSIEKNSDHSNYSENCYYLGECYYALNQEKNAIKYFIKVDSIFKNKNYISLLTIPCYNKIIDYYKKNNDYNKVIYFSEQFIKADKLLDGNYKYISEKITKKYDIKKIISSKEEAISELNSSQLHLLIIALILSIIVIIFFIKYKNNTEEIINQKKLFDEYIMLKEIEIKNNFSSSKTKLKETTIQDLGEKVINNLIKSLENFELNEGFLNNELTIEVLSFEFKTNSNYLSRFINETKELNFTQYINSLRINYIIDKLESNKKYLNYSIQALSEVSGFNSSQTFTRAFFNHTGIKPSEFIKQLKNRNLDYS